MTREEFETYRKYDELFKERCKVICKILSVTDRDYYYLDEFYIEDTRVYGEGTEYWAFGGADTYCKAFPLEWVYAEDDVIHAYVKEQERIAREKAEAVLEKQKELAEKRDREEYERLKKKYEG